MLLDAIDEADGPDALRAAWFERLRDVVSTVGPEQVVTATSLDPETVEALAAGDRPAIDLETAAAVLALAPESHDPEFIRLGVLDELLLGMTTAVVDVETVAANVAPEMDPKGVQQRLEGRAPISLEELAAIGWFLDERAP